MENLPDCDVCINKEKYLDEEGELTVYHVNRTKQHPENWTAIVAGLMMDAAKREDENRDYTPKKVPSR